MNKFNIDICEKTETHKFSWTNFEKISRILRKYQTFRYMWNDDEIFAM